MDSFMITSLVDVQMPNISNRDPAAEPFTEVEQVSSTQVAEAAACDEDDDDCAICYSTLYRPVRTQCRHSACGSCMLHWALTAMNKCTDFTNMPSNLTVDGINFRCPTCRSYTTATIDTELDDRLRARYPDEYTARAAEEKSVEDVEIGEFDTQNMLIMIGNSHRKIDPEISPYSGRTLRHEWTFFLKSSHTELIRGVQVILHPSYLHDRLVTLRQAPFSTTHKAWGNFTLSAGIHLAEGYQWVDEHLAVDSSRDHEKDILPLDWHLQFGGTGGQMSKLVKFRKIRPELAQEESDEDLTEFSFLTESLSETEIEELRRVRRIKRAEQRGHDALKGTHKKADEMAVLSMERTSGD